jgi:N-6 DNA Methylase
MATRKKTRAREAQLAFEALSIEGGLLSPDWLSRAAQLAAGRQSEADYRIPKGLNLRDEIGRFWRIAQAHWGDFDAGRAAKADAKLLAERFVEALLKDSFGFATLVKTEPAVLAERSYPIGFVALSGHVPVVVAPAGTGLDSLSPAFGDGVRRRTAFGLAQEYLNAADDAMWGLASDGLTLRIVRDNASLTRPAWIEVDLQRIFTEERYADFAALWLLVHETRFGRVDQPVAECALEGWLSAGREEGTRAREHLRRGVEDALIALGQGFLAHPDNQALRAALQSGALSTKDYFNQLLRLVYRLIFLLTVEERGVLHPDGADEKSKTLYAAGYSLRRLRERSVKRSAHDRFADLWEVTKIVFRGVDGGEQRLGLPALAGIFAKGQCPALDLAKLENRALLLAVFKLSWLREDSGLARVNWRDMGPEELGSVYESLLELVPQITKDGRQFAFATGGETKGNARKTTGSYYTPDSLVQVLLDSTLEPVVKDTIAKHPENPVQALLGLSIVDPACGSGHFLLAAARRLAAHVARLSANGTPSAAEYRHALRQVVGHCIYGVDLNPMAVELCKVSLWMEAVEPGLPLTFLNSHIQHGNALLGTTPELMAKGIPDAAWEPIEGDDKKVASALKRKNKVGDKVEYDLFASRPRSDEAQVVARAVAELEAASDANPEALAQKELRWDGILGSTEYRHQKLVADAWCAAFVWPKQPGELSEGAPTNELWRQLRDGLGQPPALTVKMTVELAEEYRFFHWNLQFPQVFAKGGFDVVLGNPPWERVKLQEQEFFASKSEQIADAANSAVRKKLIAMLPEGDPRLWHEWCAASRTAEGESQLVRRSGCYPLCGKGDVNSYSLFVENGRRLRSGRGRAGMIVPSGIATDNTTKEFFADIVASHELAVLLDFENRQNLFPGVGHGRMRFCLITVGHAEVATVAFQLWNPTQLQNPTRTFELTADDIRLLNPNTRTCPVFATRRDAEITKAIYRRVPVLWRDDGVAGNPWALHFMRMLDMANDSGLFHTLSDLEGSEWRREGNRFVRDERLMLPLVEAKMVHHFNHRFGDYSMQPEGSESTILPDVPTASMVDPNYAPTPRYWVDDEEVRSRLEGRWDRGWFLGWRDITHATNERTVVGGVIARAAVNDKFLLMLPGHPGPDASGLVANLAAFVFDYASRQKVGGISLKYFTMKQLPVLPPTFYAQQAPWSAHVTLRDWLLPRVLELTYTAWDLEAFARDIGHDGPPFRWDLERRFQLRCELDAAFFHLYGLSRDDVGYVMDTFPIVRKHDEKAHGEFRTKRVILEIYDVIAEATRTGKPYDTRLDPPPADPRVAHPDTRPSVEKGRAG